MSILLALILSLNAQADYVCVNSKAKVLVSIAEDVRAEFQSEEFFEYYRPMGIDIQKLETVIDPETQRPTTEEIPNGYRFLMHAISDSDLDGVWGLDFEFNSEQTSARVTVVDMDGTRFFYELPCVGKSK